LEFHREKLLAKFVSNVTIACTPTATSLAQDADNQEVAAAQFTTSHCAIISCCFGFPTPLCNEGISLRKSL